MKFILNEFPDDKNFDPKKGWTALKESTNMWVVQIQSLPILLLMLFSVEVLFEIVNIDFSVNFLEMGLAFLIFMPIHELIHAICFPEGMDSENLYFGFSVKGLVFFAAYIGEMERNRFILTLCSPFVIITVVGFLILSIIGSNSLIEHIIMMNAIGSSMDIFNVIKIIRQIPRNAVVKNKRVRTFWKEVY